MGPRSPQHPSPGLSPLPSSEGTPPGVRGADPNCVKGLGLPSSTGSSEAAFRDVNPTVSLLRPNPPMMAQSSRIKSNGLRPPLPTTLLVHSLQPPPLHAQPGLCPRAFALAVSSACWAFSQIRLLSFLALGSSDTSSEPSLIAPCSATLPVPRFYCHRWAGRRCSDNEQAGHTRPLGLGPPGHPTGVPTTSLGPPGKQLPREKGVEGSPLGGALDAGKKQERVPRPGHTHSCSAPVPRKQVLPTSSVVWIPQPHF